VEFAHKGKLISPTRIFNYEDLIFLNLPWSKGENGLKNNFIIDELTIFKYLTGKSLNLKNNGLPRLNVLNFEKNLYYEPLERREQKRFKRSINQFLRHVDFRHHEEFLVKLNIETSDDIGCKNILDLYNKTDLTGNGWGLTWQTKKKSFIYPLRVCKITQEGYKKSLVQIVIGKKGNLVTMFPVFEYKCFDIQ
jgi:hypothetical protein